MAQEQRIHRHVLIYGLGAVALQATNLLLMPLYTHYLDTTEYGVLQIIYRIGEVFHICLMVQAVKLATFNLFGNARSAEARERTAASVAVVTLLAMLIGGCMVLLIGPWIADRYGAMTDSKLLVCGVLTVMLQALTVMPIAMMQARYESIPFVGATLGIAISHLTLSSLGVAVMGWGIWGVIFSLAATHGTFGIALTLRELLKNSFRPDWLQVKHFVRFSAPLIPVGILSMAMHSGDQFFLMSSHGAAAVGVYAIAYRITQALEMFAFEPLCQIWHPWIYDVFQAEDGPRKLGRAATAMLGVYLFAGLGLVLLRNEVIDLLSANDYQDAANYIPTLILAFFFMSASCLADASFFLTSRTGRRTIVAVFSAAVMLALYAILIPRYGAMGAAWSTLLGFAANYAVNLLLAQRVYRVEYEVDRIVWLCGSAVVLVLIGEQLGDGLVWILPKTVLWLCWPIMVWLLGLIRETEMAMIRRAASRIPWIGTRLSPESDCSS